MVIPSTFLSQPSSPALESPQQQPKPPGIPKRIAQSIWSRMPARPTPIKSAGQSLASGAVQGAETELHRILTSDKLSNEGRKFIDTMLFAQSSQQMRELNALLQLALRSPKKLTVENIDSMDKHLKTILASEAIDENARSVLTPFSQFISDLKSQIQPSPSLQPDPFEQVDSGMGVLPDFQPAPVRPPKASHGVIRQAITSHTELVKEAEKTLSGIVKSQQGALIKAVSFLRETLLNPQDGLLEEVNAQLISGEKSILKGALDLLTRTLLGQADQELIAQKGVAGGFADVVNKALTDEENGILKRSLDILMRKPHPRLAELKALLKECRSKLGTPSTDAQRRKLIEDSLALIETIRKERRTIFAHFPLPDADIQKFKSITIYLQSVLSNTHSLTAKHLKRVEDFVEELCAKQRGQGVELLDHIDNLPAIWIQSVKKALIGIEGPAAEGDAQAGAMGGFLGSLGGMFKEMLGKGAAALSKEAASSLTGLMASFITKLNTKIERTPECEEQRNALGLLILRLQTTQEPSFNSLYTHFMDLVKICDSMNICVNGLYLPHTTDSDESNESLEIADNESSSPDYYKNIQTLRSAHAVTTTPVKQNFEALASKEKDIFIEKTTDFLTLKYIYETILGRQPDRTLYLRMMDKAKKSSMPLENLIFEDLKRENVSWYVSWWQIVCAWFVYKISHSLIQGFVKRGSDAYFKEIFQYIKKQKDEHFEDFIDVRLTQANDYLTILDQAFKTLPTINPAYGSPSTMLEREMENPKRNHFLTVDQIYAEFAQNVIKKASGNRLISWIFGKVMGHKKEEIVRYIVNSSVTQSLTDSTGYAHALNTVICQLLQEIDDSLQNPLDSGVKLPPLADARKKQLSSLVKNLLSVLEKSKCETLTELQDLNSGKKSIENPLDFFKDFLSKTVGVNIEEHIIHEVIEAATLSLAESLESMVQEDKLQQLTFKFSQLLNQGYDIGITPPTDIEKATMESRVQQLSTSILRKSIAKAINEKTNAFTEQNQVNQAVYNLKDQTQEWSASTQTALEALECMDLSSPDARIKVRTLYDEALAFQVEQDRALVDISNNQWNEINKREIVKRHKDIALAIKPLIEKITFLEKEMFNLENQATLVPHLDNIIEGLKTIGTTDSAPLTTRLQQLRAIDKSLKEAGPLLSVIPSPAFIRIKKDFEEFSKSLLKRDKVQIARDFLSTLVVGTATSIDQLIAAKRATPSTLPQAYASLQQEILRAIPEANRPSFMTALSRLAKSQTLSEDETIKKTELITLCQRTLANADTSFNACTLKTRLLSENICSSIEHSGLLDPQYRENRLKSVQEKITDSLNLVGPFQQRAAKMLSYIPFVNIRVINPKTFKKKANDIVYATTKKYADESIKFVARKDTGKSLLRHMFLIPYNTHEREPKAESDSPQFSQTLRT